MDDSFLFPNIHPPSPERGVRLLLTLPSATPSRSGSPVDWDYSYDPFSDVVSPAGPPGPASDLEIPRHHEHIASRESLVDLDVIPLDATRPVDATSQGLDIEETLRLSFKTLRLEADRALLPDLRWDLFPKWARAARELHVARLYIQNVRLDHRFLSMRQAPVDDLAIEDPGALHFGSLVVARVLTAMMQAS